MNSNNKTSKRELIVKFSGPILFSVFFAMLCIGIFKFLPEDAPINSEYVIASKDTNSDEEEWQKSILVNPSDYHTKVVEHKNQKVDIGLELYRSALSKSSVVWFYNQITGNQDVTLAILTAAEENDIPLSLAFALAYTESRYKVTAVNSNTNKCEPCQSGECNECHQAIPNCAKCEDDPNNLNNRKCLECYSPYVLNQETNECDLCQYGYHYETSSKTCQQNKNKCEIQIENECYRCEIGYVLTKGECISETGECHIKTSKTCEECRNSNQITTSGKCETIDKCSYSTNDGTNNQCLQ